MSLETPEFRSLGHPLLLAQLGCEHLYLATETLSVLVEVPDHLSLPLHHLRELVRTLAPDDSVVGYTWQDCRGELFPKYVWKQGLGVVVSQDVDVGDHQANNHHGLQSDQTPEVVDLGERVTATLAAVAEVVKDHHHDHEYRVANREDVEWCTANVLCSYVEV